MKTKRKSKTKAKQMSPTTYLYTSDLMACRDLILKRVEAGTHSTRGTRESIAYFLGTRHLDMYLLELIYEDIRVEIRRMFRRQST